MEKYSWDTITCFEDTITCVSIINNSDTENHECTISASKRQEREIAGDL